MRRSRRPHRSAAAVAAQARLSRSPKVICSVVAPGTRNDTDAFCTTSDTLGVITIVAMPSAPATAVPRTKPRAIAVIVAPGLVRTVAVIVTVLPPLRVTCTPISDGATTAGGATGGGVVGGVVVAGTVVDTDAGAGAGAGAGADATGAVALGATGARAGGGETVAGATGAGAAPEATESVV